MTSACYTVLGWVGDRPLPVIYVDGEPDERIIITLYDPSAVRGQEPNGRAASTTQ